MAGKPLSDDVIEKIADVFRAHGYEGATLTRISEATGLKRGSLYHHFPGGKEDMARAVMEMLGERVRAELLSPLSQADAPPRERLQQWADAVVRFYSGGKKNCMLGAMVLSGGDAPLKMELRLGVTGWINAIAQVLQDAGATKAEARKRARHSVERIQGSLIVARALGDSGTFAREVRDLPNILLAGLET